MALSLRSGNICRSIIAVIATMALSGIGDCIADNHIAPAPATRPLLKLAEAQFAGLTRARKSRRSRLRRMADGTRDGDGRSISTAPRIRSTSRRSL